MHRKRYKPQILWQPNCIKYPPPYNHWNTSQVSVAMSNTLLIIVNEFHKTISLVFVFVNEPWNYVAITFCKNMHSPKNIPFKAGTMWELTNMLYGEFININITSLSPTKTWFLNFDSKMQLPQELSKTFLFNFF